MVHTQLNVWIAGVRFVFQQLPAEQHTTERQLTLRKIGNHDPLNRTADTSRSLVARNDAKLINARL